MRGDNADMFVRARGVATEQRCDRVRVELGVAAVHHIGQPAPDARRDGKASHRRPGAAQKRPTPGLIGPEHHLVDEIDDGFIWWCVASAHGCLKRVLVENLLHGHLRTQGYRRDMVQRAFHSRRRGCVGVT